VSNFLKNKECWKILSVARGVVFQKWEMLRRKQYANVEVTKCPY
jgi:hypothetical protein